MRIAFAGTPEFARLALQALLDAGHEVVLALCQPDRPAGRGMRLQAGPVRELARQAGIPACQPRGLRLDGRWPDDARQAREALEAARPDVMVVAAYGLILPAWVLALPPSGCLNIHASLLPRWRGAAPIQRAIEAGDALSGITIMQMDEGLDTGDMLLRCTLPIGATHTAASLHDDLAVLGGQAIVRALAMLEAGTLQARPQPEEGVTYAAKLQKSEAPLDFSRPAVELERRIRAFQPFPVATMNLPGIAGSLRVWRAQALPGPKNGPAPGSLIQARSEGLDMATGQGVLRILELQRPGGRRQPVGSFLSGWQAPAPVRQGGGGDGPR